MKIYYKVVTSKLRSIVHGNNSILSVQYKLNEWVTPHIKGSSLLVFSNLERAKMFAQGWGGCIYECKVKNPRKKGPFVRFGNTNSGYVYQQLNLLIQNYIERHKKLPEDWEDAPDGTVFCSAVKLLRKV